MRPTRPSARRMVSLTPAQLSQIHTALDPLDPVLRYGVTLRLEQKLLMQGQSVISDALLADMLRRVIEGVLYEEDDG